MRFEPFRARHLDRIDIQETQRRWRTALTPEAGIALEGLRSWSAIFDGEVVACAGVLPIWPGRAAAWALLSNGIGPSRFVALHRRVRTELDRAADDGFRRIETEVDPKFPRGRALRWAEMLGFQVEAVSRRFMPDGSDMLRMVRLT